MVCASGTRSDQDEQWLGHGVPFLPCSEHRAGSIRVLDDGSDFWGWPSALLRDACALGASAPEFILGVTILASVSFSPCRLQSAVWGVVPLAEVFLGVLGIGALPIAVDCLFRSHFLDTIKDATGSPSGFFL